jgi:glutamate dehydrogenase/leucine dehydrogenase
MGENIQQFSWQKERVDRELTEIMRKAYAAVREVVGEHSIDLESRPLCWQSGEWVMQPRRECIQKRIFSYS